LPLHPCRLRSSFCWLVCSCYFQRL
jgi:hypothetical protein